MADFTNSLWRQRDHSGDSWSAHAFSQLRKRYRTKDDTHLLYTAAKQLPQFFPIFVCDINSEGWTGHTQSMPQKHF